jgi:ATP-dependent helicase/nuclease subunit A
MRDAPGADPRAEAEAAQRRAADPAVSAWVGASAGSGKTTLLTARVLRLLLGGTDPGRILCLTFTRAAAAEMATRIAARLGDWAAMEDTALADALSRLGVAASDDAMARARGLFARVLDQPGGLRIATIHAFCQSLLRRFPLEAQVAPHFALIEERDSAEVLAAARDEALAAPTAAMERALGTLAPLVESEGFSDLVRGVLGAHAKLERALAASNAPDGIAAIQRRVLAVGLDDTEESLLAEACARDLTRLTAAESALRRGSPTDMARGEAMRRWLALTPADRIGCWEEWRGLFLKATDGMPFKDLAHKKAIAAMPDIVSVMQEEAEAVRAVEERRRRVRAAAASEALVRLVSPVIEGYERRKRVRAGLDYDDLIERTRRLLASTDTAWVQYKLDGGLDHVLLDEAQDSSAAQWDVVEQLTAEFFAGEGARAEVARTVFAVGDVKQSIYRFQGAEPEQFAHAREAARRRVSAAHGPGHFRAEQLAVSFRSTPPVLALVDAVFADPAAADGVALDGAPIAHRPARLGQAGLVELWPAIPPDDIPEAAGWDPEPSRRARGGEEKLARAIAARIAGWLSPASPEMLPARGRAMRPGDILVLVRRRRDFVGHLIRGLKERNVPVSGIDRLVLADALAVMDVLATLDALLLPEDDLTLAAALRSPLFGLSDPSLMALASGRGRRSLRAELRRRAAERDDWRAAEAMLAALAARADFDTPYALIARLLGPLGGRARLLARLGPDAADPLDELCNAALAHERSHPPALQGFLAWLRAGGAEIKREQEPGADAVRVMTVHGAKGLESPVVILADTTTVADPRERLHWLADPATGAEVPLWAPRKEFRAAPVAEAEAREQAQERAEYRRLLYVALTRAEDRLLVTGALNRKGTGKDPCCWYDLVEAGFRRLEGAEGAAFDPGALLGEPGWPVGGMRLETAQDPGAPLRRDPESAAPASLPAVPPWARQPPPAEETPPRPLAPSADEEDEPAAASPVGGPDAAAERRFRRGTLVHALLQHLPDLPPERRRSAAEAFLSAPGLGLAADTVAELVAETVAILDDPRFAPLFAPGALAEAPVTGRIGARVVAGQVDRLAIGETEILVADFKTNRPPPGRVEEVAPAYLRQMAAYRAVLRGAFPGRAVRCALVWTYAARMMELPEALLDAHAPAPI